MLRLPVQPAGGASEVISLSLSWFTFASGGRGGGGRGRGSAHGDPYPALEIPGLGLLSASPLLPIAKKSEAGTGCAEQTDR